MTTYRGTAGADSLTYYNWDYAWTHFYMGEGDDTVIVPGANTSYLFSGEGGNDLFQGGRRTDNAFGGIGNDTLAGAGGDDFLSGDAGNDRLIGGVGSDWLKGGEGIDHFVFSRGESPSAPYASDTIFDWDVNFDYIDSSVRGTQSKYVEFETNHTSIAYIQRDLSSSVLSTKDHVFAYNKATDTGYLLSNLDNVGGQAFETAVIIKGAGSAADMNWSDII